MRTCTGSRSPRPHSDITAGLTVMSHHGDVITPASQSFGLRAVRWVALPWLLKHSSLRGNSSLYRLYHLPVGPCFPSAEATCKGRLLQKALGHTSLYKSEPRVHVETRPKSCNFQSPCSVATTTRTRVTTSNLIYSVWGFGGSEWAHDLLVVRRKEKTLLDSLRQSAHIPGLPRGQ